MTKDLIPTNEMLREAFPGFDFYKMEVQLSGDVTLFLKILSNKEDYLKVAEALKNLGFREFRWGRFTQFWDSWNCTVTVQIVGDSNEYKQISSDVLD